jgi:hypothetical protein
MIAAFSQGKETEQIFGAMVPLQELLTTFAPCFIVSRRWQTASSMDGPASRTSWSKSPIENR